MRLARVLTSLIVAAVAAQGPVAPPALAVPVQAHAGVDAPAWLDCPSRATMRSARGVVLLVPGTGSKPEEVWSWSYEPALAADGFATCTVALPDDGLGSFTTAAKRVRRAIKATARLADRRISVVGHSQGGALPVWAVKFWAGSAQRVKDVVSLAGPFGGTRLGNELCAASRCATLAWQLRVGAHHVAALQHAPLPTGRRAPSVTSIAGLYDEIVRPQPTASRLGGAANVILQDVCAHDPSEHGLILGDPVGYALTLDALTHRGPADPSRLPVTTCEQTFIPHGDLAGSYVFLDSLTRFTTGLLDPRRWVDAEPPVPAYARPWAG